MIDRDDTDPTDGNDGTPGPSEGDGPTGVPKEGQAEPAPAPAPGPAPEPARSPLEIELEDARRKQREAEARLRSVSKAYTDLESEMDSFRRRMTLQADQRVERRTAELVERFFEPVQNLRRSLAAGKADPATVIAGVEMTLQQFTDALAKMGLEQIPGVGATFDPNIHEALAITPVSDKSQDGKVLLVHAVGWRLGGKVLQPAQVVIGKYTESAEA